jgi:hypothetical protein
MIHFRYNPLGFFVLELVGATCPAPCLGDEGRMLL